MKIEIPDTLTLTPALKAALLKAVATITYEGYDESGFNSQVDIVKIDLAEAFLAALDLPVVSPSPFIDQTSMPATQVARRRPTMPFEKRARIVARDGFKCVQCGSESNLEVDHKKPVAKGGTDDDSNLQTLCGNCNRKKGATEPDA